MDISISQTKSFRIRRQPITQLFVTISRLFPRYAGGSVSVVFVTNREIAKLNQTYRGKRGPTDVLSFAERETESFVHDAKLIGEIVIAVPYARRQAAAQGITMRQEINWLLAHGFLHLIGYDHQQFHAAQRMKSLEQKILSSQSA